MLLSSSACAAPGEKRSPSGCGAGTQDAENALFVRGRRLALAAAVTNLIENATQHRAPGSVVSVRIFVDGATVVTTVHNAGEPISAANLLRIWDRFFTTRAAQGGSGQDAAAAA